MHQHCNAQAQQAVGTAARVCQQRVPQPHGIWETVLLHVGHKPLLSIDCTEQSPKGSHVKAQGSVLGHEQAQQLVVCLGQQERYPPKGVELWVNLQNVKGVLIYVVLSWLQDAQLSDL